MKDAAHVVAVEVMNNRLVVAPLEPRAGIARYDAATQTMDLELTGQGLHGIRRQLAEFIFKVPPERIQLSAPDVGGGFGMKNFLYPEWVLLLCAARKLGRPVRWVAERAEEFVSGTQGRDIAATAKLALDATGRILALDVAMVANMGAYLSGNGPGASVDRGVDGAGRRLRHPRDRRRRARRLHQHGAGRRLSRRRQARGQLHHRARDRGGGAHARPRSGRAATAEPDRRFPAQDRAWAWRSIRAASSPTSMPPSRAPIGRASRRGVRRRRRAAGCAASASAASSRPRAARPTKARRSRFEPDGTVTIAVGTESNGQGHETAFAQIAADRLGLPIETFRYVQADTRAVKSGAGHGGARSMHMGGAALVKAIDAALAKARRLAAHLLAGVGRRTRLSPTAAFPCAEATAASSSLSLAKSATDRANLPDGMTPGLGEHVMNMTDVFTFPSGCHVAEVEIDPETGAALCVRYTAVDDYGRLINPMLTEGQVQGGVTQGIGQAMLEHTVYDPSSGQLLSGSFMDYALPRADDLPSFDIELVERPTAGQSAGRQGLGPGRLHRRTADRDGRHPRRAARRGRRAARHAGDARARVAGASRPSRVRSRRTSSWGGRSP